MNLGIDYSLARPGAAAIKAAGYSFVCRYLASYPPKAISSAEVTDLLNNGLTIVLVFEDYANQALNGFNQGVADAKEALGQANAVGQPSDRPIYFAVDFDATEAQQAPIDDYLRGAASVIGINRVGIYGGYYVVLRCSQNGTAKWFWQTLGWSGGQQFAGNHIYQNGQSAFNGGADVDEAKQADFGQWPVGEDMATIAELETQVAGLQAELTGERAGYQALLDKANGLSTELDGERAGYAVRVAYEQAVADALGIAHAPDQVPPQDTVIKAINNLKGGNQPTPTPTPTPTPVPTPHPTPTPSKPPRQGAFWDFLRKLGFKV